MTGVELTEAERDEWRMDATVSITHGFVPTWKAAERTYAHRILTLLDALEAAEARAAQAEALVEAGLGLADEWEPVEVPGRLVHDDVFREHARDLRIALGGAK